MGTNYYGKKMLKTEEINIENVILKLRNNEIEDAKSILDGLVKKTKIHIGKTSCGWKFIFNGNDMKFDSINDFKDFLKGFEITSEYGNSYSFEEFWEIVDNRQDFNSFDNDYITNFTSLADYLFSKSTNFC